MDNLDEQLTNIFYKYKDIDEIITKSSLFLATPI